MKKYDIGIIVTLLCLSGFGLVSISGASGHGIEQKVASKCSSCHTTNRICQSLNDKDADGWRTTVLRMEAKGLVLSETGRKEIVDYLAGDRTSKAGLCGK
ncbi:MAG TPA: hypothetical protein VJ934_07895 [Desulfomicrobiaceae bacterium]|nr:hypothetical protein [Desulfomicrobiaceae bacterium]